MTTLLAVGDLAFGYAGRPLFDGWSHAFAPGLTWVRGENGCGKSTLLRLLGGALEPLGGSIRCGAIDARDRPLEYRREVCWCGPDTIAFDHLKPGEFFGFMAGLYPRFDADVAEAWVRTFGLEPFLDRRISALSTGTRRKVAVVAAIAAGTTVVILDEPLAGLDQASLKVMRAALADAADQRERIWIIASHEPIGDAAASTIDLPAPT
jgi:ABC-type multidrug transport system ATPase subunit